MPTICRSAPCCGIGTGWVCQLQSCPDGCGCPDLCLSGPSDLEVRQYHGEISGPSSGPRPAAAAAWAGLPAQGQWKGA